MSCLFETFIRDSLDHRYRGKTVADSMGNPFKVAYIQVSQSEDGIEGALYENVPSSSQPSGDQSHFSHFRHFWHWESMPEILNLRYDETIKGWVPYPISPLS